MKKSPVSLVTERFESKAKLVDAVQKLATADLWLDRVNSVKGLGRVSNAKLVRLHDALTDVKKRFGSRDKLIGSLLDIHKRTKDEGYKARLASYPLPRLLDLHSTATRSAKRADAGAKAAAAKPAKAEKPKAAKTAKPKATKAPSKAKAAKA
jgi:hypothetical protein